MARTRYTKYESFAIGSDLLSTAICIDVVPFPYANDTVAAGSALGYSKDGDTTTLAPIGFEIGPIKVAVSSSGVADEATVDSLSLNIYDVGNTVWNIFEGVIENYNTQRLQLVLWENSSGAMQPRFYGIDIASIQPELNTVVAGALGATYDVCIKCTAIELGKQVLQDAQAFQSEAVALAEYGWTGSGTEAGNDTFRIIFQVGTGSATLFSNTTSDMDIGWSADYMLAFLRVSGNWSAAAFPTGGVHAYKYFISCFQINNFNPTPGAGLNQSGNVYILEINTRQLGIDYSTAQRAGAVNMLNSGEGNDANVNPGTGTNLFYSYIAAFNGGTAQPPPSGYTVISYNVIRSTGAVGPLAPLNVTLLSQVDARLLANSQYVNPTNVWQAYYFYYAEAFNGGKFSKLANNNFASFNDTLAAIAYIIRLATDIITTETVTCNIEWLGAKAVKPTDSTTHYDYGAGYEISTTTGIGTSTLAGKIALNETLILNASNPTEYCLSNQATLYGALKLMCDSVLGFPYLTYTSGILNLKIFSMLSADFPDLVYGNQELVPIAKTSKIKSCAFSTDSASVGIKKPQGANAPWTQNDDASGAGDILSTQFFSPSSHNGSNVSGTSMFGTFWNNWTPAGTAGGNIAWLENSLMLFASSGSPPDVFEASYSMFNNNLNADPLYSPGSSPPNIYVFVVNQGFGGGTLQGGNVQLAYYPHWQFALCAGIFSMFCTPQNSEMIETEVPLTLALINSLRVNPIAARVALRTTAVFNFLTMSVEYNIFGVERTLKLTAVRSRT